MLINQTLDKLDALGLFGMAMGVREQLELTQYANLSFEERLGVLVDREADSDEDGLVAGVQKRYEAGLVTMTLSAVIKMLSLQGCAARQIKSVDDAS